MIDSRPFSGFYKFFPSMLSGLMLTLCFPDANCAFLVFFAMLPWLISTRSFNMKQTAAGGFIMGLVHYLTLIYWIVPTVHIYGRLNIILAASVLILLCFYLALYPAVFAIIVKKKFADNTFRPFWAACLWTGLEFIRTHLFTGFPWGALGYSQYSNLLLIQIADFSGVLGVSFLIVFVNYSIFQAFCLFKADQALKGWVCILYPLIAMAAVLTYGRFQMDIYKNKITAGPKTNIAVIQGNIEQDQKWSQDFKESTVDKYIYLSESLFERQPDLIIWPETALPFYYGFDQVLTNRVGAAIRESRTNFLIGSPAFERKDNRIFYYNRAFLIDLFSVTTSVYDKNHLVPFGEYVPFGNYLTFLGKITEHAGNFSSGDPLFAPLAFNDHKTGVLICFEILFPSISARFVQNGADMLTTITNDAWFGYTPAAYQHFSIAVFRAVENRRALARAANTGISGFIDPVGRIYDTTALFTDQAVIRRLPALDTLTFYTCHPHLPGVSCLIAICLYFMVKGLNKKFRRKNHERRT